MIGTIFAAGRGSRISKVSKKPKSFLKLNSDFSIIDYQINMLEKISVKKIFIIIGYKRKLFEKKFKDCKNIKLIFNKNWYRSNVLESFRVVSRYIKNNFIFLHADALLEKDVYKKLKNQKKICLIYKKKKCGSEEMKLYKIRKKNFLSKETIDEKLIGEFTGLAYIPYKYLKIIKKEITLLKKNKNYKKFFFEEILNILSAKYNVTFDLINIGKRKFVEVDFKEDYSLAKKYFK